MIFPVSIWSTFMILMPRFVWRCTRESKCTLYHARIQIFFQGSRGMIVFSRGGGVRGLFSGISLREFNKLEFSGGGGAVWDLFILEYNVWFFFFVTSLIICLILCYVFSFSKSVYYKCNSNQCIGFSNENDKKILNTTITSKNE